MNRDAEDFDPLVDPETMKGAFEVNISKLCEHGCYLVMSGSPMILRFAGCRPFEVPGGTGYVVHSGNDCGCDNDLDSDANECESTWEGSV